jgi:hypothetical protein
LGGREKGWTRGLALAVAMLALVSCAGAHDGHGRASATTSTVDPRRLVPTMTALPSGMTFFGVGAIGDGHVQPSWIVTYGRNGAPATDDVTVLGFKSSQGWSSVKGATEVRVHGTPAQVVSDAGKGGIAWRADGLDLEVSTDHPGPAAEIAERLVDVASAVRIDPTKGPRLGAQGTIRWQPLVASRGVHVPDVPVYSFETGDSIVSAIDSNASMDDPSSSSSRILIVTDWDHPWSDYERLARRGHGHIERILGGRGQVDVDSGEHKTLDIVHVGSRSALVYAQNLTSAEMRSVLDHLTWRPERAVKSSVDAAVAKRPGPGPAYIGIRGGPASTPDGLVVSEAVAGAPAATAGIQRDDVILTVDDHPMRHLLDLVQLMAPLGPGDQITVQLRRGQIPMTVVVTIGSRPR